MGSFVRKNPRKNHKHGVWKNHLVPMFWTFARSENCYTTNTSTLLILVRDSNAEKFQVSKTWETLFFIKMSIWWSGYKILEKQLWLQDYRHSFRLVHRSAQMVVSKNHVSFSSSEFYDSLDFFTEIKNDSNQKTKRRKLSFMLSYCATIIFPLRRTKLVLNYICV